ncbi:MAG: hypothetical protein ACI9VX_001887, partial [Dinoroseobacter sp.]
MYKAWVYSTLTMPLVAENSKAPPSRPPFKPHRIMA